MNVPLSAADLLARYIAAQITIRRLERELDAAHRTINCLEACLGSASLANREHPSWSRDCQHALPSELPEPVTESGTGPGQTRPDGGTEKRDG